MWEGDTEDTIRRSLEGQFPQVMPDNFHSRQQIYLFANIKAKSGQRISLDQKAAAAQDGKHQRIIGDRHSQLPRVPSKSVIITFSKYYRVSTELLHASWGGQGKHHLPISQTRKMRFQGAKVPLSTTGKAETETSVP